MKNPFPKGKDLQMSSTDPCGLNWLLPLWWLRYLLEPHLLESRHQFFAPLRQFKGLDERLQRLDFQSPEQGYPRSERLFKIDI